MVKEIEIIIGDKKYGAELNDTKIASKIYDILPVSGLGDRWGDEIYFSIPLNEKNERPQEEVDIGDLAYWPPGKGFCILFGKTPVSRGGKPKLASAGTAIGKIYAGAKRVKRNRKYSNPSEKERVTVMADIFISRRIFREAIEKLEESGHRVEVNDSSRILPKEELIEKIRGKSGLICFLNDTIDTEVLNSNPDLKVISNVAVGYDNIDVEAATKQNVMVTNTPGILTETTADLAFSLLMSAARRIPEADRYSRAGKYEGWELMQPHTGVDVYGKTLGIIGMGRVGTAVARRGHKGFDMHIMYYDVRRNEEAEKELGAEFVDFDEVLKRSDFISIHAPLIKETKRMFSTEEFKKMKNNAILINAARGPIVDEDALVEALKKGEIRGIAIDTFEKEPKVHPELAKIEEYVVLAPHIGSASRATRLKMAMMAVDNMIAGLKGERPPNLVNKDVVIK